MKKPLLCLLLLISGLSHATETTLDYAYGATIKLTDEASMYNRIDLTNDVYTQTISSHLDDVRVFNQKGQPVPYSLVNIYQQNNESQTFPASIYSLDNSRKINSDDNSNQDLDRYNININSKDIQINLDKTTDKDSNSATYLLQIPDDIKIKPPITSLSIDFDTTKTQNWQATAELLCSYDLKNWRSVMSDIPIMSLTDNNNNQSLKLNTIDIPAHYNQQARYWIIVLTTKQNTIPNIKTVEFTTNHNSTEVALFPINSVLTNSNHQEATYELPSPQPVKELTVQLADTRSVLPLSIYYKTSNEDKTWHKLNDYIIRRVYSEDEPQRIKLDHSNLNIQQLQIKAINASFDDAPKITAYRDRMSLIFNSSNNGPFILAWGSIKATSASLTEQALLSNAQSAIDLPQAYLDDRIELGGKNALIQTTTEPSHFPKWVIWICLIAGAVFLIFLAIKLVNEIKKTSNED
ncbi:DUF3999 family protein [Gilliamella sp. wkB112]|uniref:DUF3999 family protein n=1 Tax=Gilliamella sp. wkB112 TaxID=3120257 RepID=UPI00080DEA04|nr:DUF3999 family protein [Gilliamella apicola]OCG01654.1 hypothetical protein A9G12_11775 [Gilliamella apicola]